MNCGESIGQFLPAGVCEAREQLVLRLLYVFCVCLLLCSHLPRAQYVIRCYATAVNRRFVGQAIASEGSFVLCRWRKLGRQP